MYILSNRTACLRFFLRGFTLVGVHCSLFLSVGAEELGPGASFAQFSTLSLCFSQIRFHLVILYCGGAVLFETDILSMLSHTHHLALFFLFFVSLFFQLHTWHSLALIRTTPHWLALDHTSVNILILCSPLYSAVCPIYSYPFVVSSFTAQIYRLVVFYK